MRIAILEAGRPPAPLIPRFGLYPEMFEHLLAAPGRDFTVIDVAAGLPGPGGFDAYLITGSSAGAYDPLPWIEPLKRFLRSAKGTPMVGVCFGHQIMAEAFGGKVVKSPKGRGIGLQTYAVAEAAAWMDPVERFALPASHGDQVVEPPPAARLLAGNDFCPYGMFAYEDQPAISIQPHPEFDPAFAKALIEGRWEADKAEANRLALESLDRPNDRARVGRWIGRFLETAAG
jgi:GMP synthase-like glutamine amidotransferase